MRKITVSITWQISVSRQKRRDITSRSIWKSKGWKNMFYLDNIRWPVWKLVSRKSMVLLSLTTAGASSCRKNWDQSQ